MPLAAYKTISSAYNTLFVMLKILFERELHVLNRKVSYDELRSFIQKTFSKVPENFCIYYRDSDDDKIELTSESDLQVVYECTNGAIKLVIERRVEEPELLEVCDESDEEIVVIDDVTPQPSNMKCSSVTQNSEALNASEIDTLIKSCIAEIIPDLTKRIHTEVSSRLVPTTKKNQAEVVHEGVRCDGCQMKPIIGARYKCAICHDFDFCSKCEDKAEHAHPFLKIRYPEQAPKSLLVCIDDDHHTDIQVNGTRFGEEQLTDVLTRVIPELSTLQPTATPKEQAPVAQTPQGPSEEEILERVTHLEDLFYVEFTEGIGFAKMHPELNKE